MSAYITIKVRVETRQQLRRITAETGETIVELLDRLTRAEWQRIKAEPDEPGNEWRRAPTQQR